MARSLALALTTILLAAGCLAIADPQPPAPSCGATCDVAIATHPWREFEPMVAINPTNGQNFLVGVDADLLTYSPYYMENPTGIRDPLWQRTELLEGPGAGLIAAVSTHDGGATWTYTLLPHLLAAPSVTSSWNLMCNQGDPITFFGADGTAYLGGVATGCTTDLRAEMTTAIFLARSVDGGLTWSDPAIVWQGELAVQFEDKPWGAIDPVTGRIAIAWTADTGALLADQENYVSFSNDGGLTWSTPPTTAVRGSPASIVPNPVWEGFPGNFFTALAWGPGGRLYEARIGDCSGTGELCTRVSTTTDEGVTWTHSTVAPLVQVVRPGPSDVWGIYPVVDVDRSGGAHDGRVYVAYASAPTGDWDVYLQWSDDEGATWSTPVRLNTDAVGNGRDQYFPGMAVDEHGVVHAAFKDRRDDPNNIYTRKTYARYDPATSSLANVLLQAPWTPDPAGNGNQWAGDYDTVAAAAGKVVVAWGQVTPKKPGSIAPDPQDVDTHVAIFS